jgi:putative membrane protein
MPLAQTLEVPYCGAPPVPGSATWNSDPVLPAVLLAAGMWGLFRLRGPDASARRGALLLGWAVLGAALVSPLCNLSVALFAARVGQHMLLALVAAPLLAFALFPPGGRGRPGLALPSLAFAAALWAWHLPGPYAATFRGDAVYWAMHVSLFGAALWLWAALLRRAEDRPDAAALAGLATAAHMGLLGALLTLAPRPLFAAHFGTTTPWGLTPLEDQQLGGLLMWVPGGLLFAAVTVGVLAAPLRRAAAAEARPGAAG